MNPPIEINIKDSGKYVDVASILDRDDFLDELFRLRKHWKLKEVLPYNSDKHWANDSIWGANLEHLLKHSDAIAPLEEILQDTNATAQLSHEERVELMDQYRKADRLLPGNAFMQDVQEVRRKYHKPPNFDRIIAHAILYGEIRDEDYVTAEIEIDYPEVDIVDYDREPKLIITLYPHYRIKDIQDLLKKEASQLTEKYNEEVLGKRLVSYDAKQNIVRDRAWYWMWKTEKENGKGSYNRIADQWNKSNQVYIDDINIIEQGVSRYRKLLNADI